MNILKLVKGAKFDFDQQRKKMLSGFESFKFFVSDHLNVKVWSRLQMTRQAIRLGLAGTTSELGATPRNIICSSYRLRKIHARQSK